MQGVAKSIQKNVDKVEPSVVLQLSRYLETKGFKEKSMQVLAMAYKSVSKMNKADQLAYPREEAESELIFAGFIIAECPLKDDTNAVMTELKEASHEVKMITGDNALTAAFIG